MRWRKREKRELNIGTQRTKRRFLFFPKCLPVGRSTGEMEWRWLERSIIIQELSHRTYFPFIGYVNRWKKYAWGDFKW